MEVAPKYAVVIALALLLAWPTRGWAGQEEQAWALWQKVDAQLQLDNELEACRLAEGLERFKGAAAYAEAEKQLLVRGISIAEPLHSYTAKQIVAVQNEAESNRAKLDMLPRLGPRPQFKDGWGTPLRVEMVSRPGYLYIVRSAGPDQAFLTDDDLAIGVRGKLGQGKGPAASGGAAGQPTSGAGGGAAAADQGDEKPPSGADLGRNSMYHGQRRPVAQSDEQEPALTPGKLGKEPAEREISLDELQEVLGN